MEIPKKVMPKKVPAVSNSADKKTVPNKVAVTPQKPSMQQTSSAPMSQLEKLKIMEEQKRKQEELKRQQELAKQEEARRQEEERRRQEELELKRKQEELERKRQEEEARLRAEQERIRKEELAREKARQEKLKKEKREKQKIRNAKRKEKLKKLFSNKKFLIPFIVGSCVLVFVVVFAICFTIHVNTQLATPVFAVYERDAGIFLTIDNVKDVSKYEIVTTDENNIVKKFTTKENIIDIKPYLNNVGKYDIMVRSLGRTKNAHSKYSEIVSVENYNIIESPLIFIDDDKNIYFDSIENAVSYTLYFKADLTSDTVKSLEVEADEGVIKVNVSEFVEGLGNYYISVVANAENGSYYLSSKPSQMLTYLNTEKLESPLKATFNESESVLKVYLNKNSATKKCCFVVDYNVKKENIYLELNNAVVKEETFGGQSVNVYEFNLSNYFIKYYANINIFACGDDALYIDSDLIIVESV